MTNRPFKYLITIIILFCMLCVTVSALSKMGSTGSEVSKIQSRLKQWGYYDGVVDGIYGTKTRDAVIKFQKKNGLTPDGIAGSKNVKYFHSVFHIFVILGSLLQFIGILFYILV